MKNYGPYVVVRRRRDGTVRFRFEVRRDRPDDWPPSRPILVDGRDINRLEDLTAEQEAQILRKAEAMYLEICRHRGQLKEQNRPPVFERSWEQLIELRRAHSTWQQLAPATQASYRSVQKRVVDFFGWDPALLPATIVESQIDKVLYTRIKSPHRRKICFLELRRLLEKAVREGWRDPGLTLSYNIKLPRPKLRTWTADDLRCAATQAITDGERGLARMMFAQWEIGQRLQDVRNFRYGHDYVDGCFGYLCHKTGREIRIRVVNPRARQILDDAYVHGDYMFPRSETGRPFTNVELTKAFTRIRKKLKDFDQKLQFRQLRHTVVLELALAGCTIPEIATVTGHALSSVHSTLKHYLRPADELAETAMHKRERHRIETALGMKGELIVDGVRCIYIGDLPEAEKPLEPPALPAPRLIRAAA